MHDVHTRIKNRESKAALREDETHMDKQRLHINLRLRLYKASVCSILTYGSEAWRLTREVSAALNGADASMVSIITGRTIRDEAAEDKTFDLVKWIRARK